MNVYEREYFVSRLRSGVYRLKLNTLSVQVKTPTIDDMVYSDEVFMESMLDSQKNGVMTEEENLEWMLEKEIWTKDKDEKIEDLKNGLENLKVQIYNFRSKVKAREEVRTFIRATEKTIAKARAEKNSMFSKTCEGIATEAKNLALFERCCYVGNELLDLEYVDINSLFYQFSSLHLSEKDIRELARNDPWRLCWNVKDHAPLFSNEPGRELSNDQKGILIWSRMYDNIQESMDCPTEDVINDDDMLDGWFIVQRKKSESERAKQELESRTSNDKIANSDEVMIVTDSQKEAASIQSMNNVHAETIRKQRMAQVKRQGKATDSDFQDRKLEIRAQANQAFKERTGR